MIGTAAPRGEVDDASDGPFRSEPESEVRSLRAQPRRAASNRRNGGCDILLAVMSVATRRPKQLLGDFDLGRLPSVGAQWVVWVPLVFVTVTGLVRLAVHLGGPFSSGGDVAFLELQLRKTLHGVVGVGPYSRFGWHEPGPAMFYLFAPLYWLTGESSRSLFLSSWLLNIASGSVAVLLIRRRAGVLAAGAAVVVLLLFVWAVGFDRLIDPWNPSLLSLPMLLVAVSAAAAFDGDPWGLGVLAASATFVTQTYIATIPVAALFSIIAVSGFIGKAARKRSATDGESDAVAARVGARRAGLAAIASLVAAAWALPVAQQLHGKPGNLGLLWKFEMHPPVTAGVDHHTLHQALAVVSDYSAAVGLGEPSDIGAHGSRLALAVAYCLLGVAVAVWWTYRGNRSMAAVAATTPAGLIAAVASGTQVTGPIHGYMFWWCTMLPLPMLIALGGALAQAAATSAKRQAPPPGPADSRGGSRRHSRSIPLCPPDHHHQSSCVVPRLP